MLKIDHFPIAFFLGGTMIFSKVVAQYTAQLLRALKKSNLFPLGGGGVNVSCVSLSSREASRTEKPSCKPQSPTFDPRDPWCPQQSVLLITTLNLYRVHKWLTPPSDLSGGGRQAGSNTTPQGSIENW